MRIRTVGYPSNISIPAYNDVSRYFQLSLPGMVDREVRFVDINVDTSEGFDNVIITASGSANSYMSNQTDGGPAPGPLISEDPCLIGGGGAISTSTGNYSFRIEIETGIATGDFIPLTEASCPGLLVELGSGDFVEIDEYQDQPAQTCFWRDLVFAAEDCVEETPGEYAALGQVENVAYGYVSDFTGFPVDTSEFDDVEVFDGVQLFDLVLDIETSPENPRWVFVDVGPIVNPGCGETTNFDVTVYFPGGPLEGVTFPVPFFFGCT